MKAVHTFIIFATTLSSLSYNPNCNAYSTIHNVSNPQKLQIYNINHVQSNVNYRPKDDDSSQNRRQFIQKMSESFFVGIGATIMKPNEASAKTDCMTDCLKNCRLIAPKDPAYCLDNCRSYCEQEDRTDGLSGSVSSSGGEMGITGIGTVVKGEDKPPSVSVPGLDFTSEKGKKLIGY